MSHTMTLLKLLIDRGPLSANQMAEASGLEIRQVYTAMNTLRKFKALQAVDTPYQITDTGRNWAWNREARAARIAAKAARPRRDMGRPAKELAIPDMPVIRRIVAAPAQSDMVVIGAVGRRSALESAWGVMA